ncbi:MAG: acetamidase/formamidase family protein [Spirochaetes bacterium]|nr:acetamidase/formamidase family protein [Spirochaetota bacterium]
MKTVSNNVYAFSKDNPPELTVPSGSVVKFVTKDCFANQITSENCKNALASFNWNTVNPATGPLAIEGAEPGDALRVEIQKIDLTGESAVLMTGKGLGICQKDFESLEARVVRVRQGFVEFSDKIKLPVRPMIGVIGVAPAGEAVNNGTPDEHGGNMDCKEIVQGAAVYLPVNVKGALLAMGDIHAVMADGESGGTGAEMPAEVTVKVDVLKNFPLPTPLIENDNCYMAVHSAKTADEAIQHAVFKAVRLVMEKIPGTSRYDAVTLVSLAADLRICQVVDPLITVRCELPKKLFE